jgi:catechol 2,3-dioxygenase-like lactoylglutathione lyase family enzyme
MTLNHITLRVSDLEKSKGFFTALLKPLGYRLLVEETEYAGYGVEDVEGKRDFWIGAGDGNQRPHSFSCLAFSASSKEMVDEFYQAGLKAGGQDNGPPGYRTQYHPGYYAAFVLDPDGHNIEAVFNDLLPTAT